MVIGEAQAVESHEPASLREWWVGRSSEPVQGEQETAGYLPRPDTRFVRVALTRITDLTVMLLSPEWARVPLPEQCVVLPFVLAPTRAIQTKHALAGEPAQLVPEGLDPSPHPPLP